jgi:hypothetical protein
MLPWILAGRRSSWPDPFLARFGMGGEDADLSSQAGADDSKDDSRNPDGLGTGLEGGGALRHLRADGLEVAKSRQRP